MAPKYKLTYFNLRGRAEMTRLILAQAGQEFEDVRIEKDKWPALKDSTPFGKLPILEVDGVVLSESRAIARFLAKKHGLAGKTPIEEALCDMLVDAAHDYLSDLKQYVLEQDEAKKKEIITKFATETLPPAFEKFQRYLEKNNGGKGFIVGDSLTWADLALAHSLHAMVNRKATLLDNWPLLKAYMERIMGQPNIKAWLAKRPVTDF